MDLEYRQHIFIHILRINNWVNILEELISYIDNAGLKGKFHLSVENHEIYTLSKVYNFAFYHRSAKILYIHLKGVTHYGKPSYESRVDWRRYMSHYLITRWNIATGYLRTYDAVGVEWKEQGQKEWSHIPQHFAGNFWWTTSQHIQTLKDPVKLDLRRENDPETWITSNKHGIYKSLYQQNQKGDSDTWDWTQYPHSHTKKNKEI